MPEGTWEERLRGTVVAQPSVTRPTLAKLRELGLAELLLLPIAVGLTARLVPLTFSFPVGDGGLFYVMADELRSGGWPMATAYNGADIPFAYPPLGLMLASALPGHLLDVMRIVPPVLSIGVALMVYLLARELVSPRAAVLALACYAIMPAGWALNGADVVRSLGVLLALTAVWVWIAYPDRRGMVSAGTLAGLAVLAHPSAAAFLALTGAVAVVRAPRLAPRVALPAAYALAVATPWLAFVVARYGVEPILSAATSHVTSFPLARLITFGPTELGALDPLIGLALVGAIWRPWLGVWTLTLVFLPATSGRFVAVGVALLCAVALERLPRLAQVGIPAAASVVAFVALVGIAPAVTPELLGEMRAAVAEKPEGTAFAVRSDSGNVIEWFPALTGAHSLGTSQGLEWVGRDAFWSAVETDAAIQRGEPVGGRLLDLRR